MTAEGKAGGVRRFLLSAQGWPYLLIPFIPAAVLLELGHADAVLIFFVAAAGIVPTAALMGLATEELAAKSGPGIGGLLNVTFGNAPELIIALIALNAGLQEVVKASIVGSIIGNILLVLGASMLVGGIKHERQTFNPQAATIQSTMLFLAAGALVMPAIFELVEGQGLPSPTAEAVELRLHGREPLARDRDRPHRAPTSPASSSPCAPTRTCSTRPMPRSTRRASAGACDARSSTCSSPGSPSG